MHSCARAPILGQNGRHIVTTKHSDTTTTKCKMACDNSLFETLRICDAFMVLSKQVGSKKKKKWTSNTVDFVSESTEGRYNGNHKCFTDCFRLISKLFHVQTILFFIYLYNFFSRDPRRLHVIDLKHWSHVRYSIIEYRSMQCKICRTVGVCVRCTRTHFNGFHPEKFFISPEKGFNQFEIDWATTSAT